MNAYPATVQALKDQLGNRVSTGNSVLDLHAADEAHFAPVRPDAVVFPESTADVVSVVRRCAADGCPIIPYGVGTSLEGHVVPIRGGITVDTSRMNAVLTINEGDLDAVVQPGVTRTQLNEALKTTGLMFTVDPGADASLGGMAATRASGTNAVRYGTMRDNVLSLEVVMADGRVIRTGTRARKSSAGYDLTRLFVGSEGTLGLITELTVRLFGQPECVAAATCRFNSIEGAVNTVMMAIQLGIPLARVELIDTLSVTALNGVAEQVEQFRQLSDEEGGDEFAWATQTEDRTALWRARHDAYYATKALRPGAEGFVTDCCVPISKLADCIAATQQIIEKSGMLAPLLGHVGDGNFHLAILIEPGNEDELARAKALSAQLSELSLSMGGTVTGEHGVGIGKQVYMSDEHGDAYSVMGDIKKAMDPNNVFNPGKLVTIN